MGFFSDLSSMLQLQKVLEVRSLTCTKPSRVLLKLAVILLGSERARLTAGWAVWVFKSATRLQTILGLCRYRLPVCFVFSLGPIAHSEYVVGLVYFSSVKYRPIGHSQVSIAWPGDCN